MDDMCLTDDTVSKITAEADQFDILSKELQRHAAAAGLGNSAKERSVRTSDELRRTRQKLAETAIRLLHLSTDPREYLELVATNYQFTVCLRWLVNLGILDHLTVGNAISYADLALLAKVPLGQLKSVVRMAILNDFLCEPEPGMVCHNRNSELLFRERSYMDWASFMTNYSVPTAFRFAEATERWGDTEAKNETAWNLAMGTAQPFFDCLREDKSMNKIFSSYMRNVTSTKGVSLDHLSASRFWNTLHDGATIVDVGGSSGHASIALAQKYPHFKFIVQDLPETIANSKSNFAANHETLSPRFEFQAHSFFEPNPVVDGDVYLLRMIIHDWPQQEALTILRHLKKALQKPNARVIVMDTVLPEPGTVPLMQERQLRVRDLTMMQVFNAKEREIESWRSLASMAGLSILSVEQPADSFMAILEIANGPEPTTNDRTTVAGKDETMVSSLSNGVLANGVHHAEATSNIPPQNPNLGCDKPVLIIGAGIGGLCLAQGLRKAGISFRVYERDLSEAYRPQGYRLKFESDAALALKELLPQEIYEMFEKSCATSMIGETDFDPISGSMTRSRAGGGLAGKQGLRASFTSDRGVLRRVLLTGIEQYVTFGKEFTGYDQNAESDTIVARFKDGSEVAGRFLVGADGVRSNVRKRLLPDMRFVDTGAMCIYGKTPIDKSLLDLFPEKGLRWMTVCADTPPLIQSILIGDSPLTLLSEPIKFAAREQSSVQLPADYVYWVLIGRKEMFAGTGEDAAKMGAADFGAEPSARLSLELTREWHPSIRSLFELQDVQNCSTLRVVSAPPEIPGWKPSASVTLLGDSIHPMSPCGGVGANSAIRDAAELANVLTAGGPSVTSNAIGEFEDGMRQRAFRSIMRSVAGSKKMFDQCDLNQCRQVET